MKTNLIKLSVFLNEKENWCKHSYHSSRGGFCIIGAIGHLFSGKEEILVKNFLASKLEDFLEQRKLKINTGKYNLTLATFNDDVSHEIIIDFLNFALLTIR